MKQPRLTDFDPKAAEHELGSPLDDMPLIKPPIANATSQSASKTMTPLQKPVVRKKPEAMEAGGKPEKYTTHLEPNLVKKIKLYAVERDMKDYEVVTDALLAYFEKNN
jgi:hypothetical protein